MSFLRAYLECSDEIQAGIRQMMEILNDPSTEEDDRDMTLLTLADALFPNPLDGKLGVGLEESEKLALPTHHPSLTSANESGVEG